MTWKGKHRMLWEYVIRQGVGRGPGIRESLPEEATIRKRSWTQPGKRRVNTGRRNSRLGTQSLAFEEVKWIQEDIILGTNSRVYVSLCVPVRLLMYAWIKCPHHILSRPNPGRAGGKEEIPISVSFSSLLPYSSESKAPPLQAPLLRYSPFNTGSQTFPFISQQQESQLGSISAPPTPIPSLE